MAAPIPKELPSRRKGKFAKKSHYEKYLKVSSVKKHSPTPSFREPDSLVGVESSKLSDVSFFGGERRIVEFDVLAKNMSCTECHELLDFKNIFDEKRYGLASILYIECNCGVINSVHTGKCHREEGKNRGVPIYDVNTKAAAGMIHAGIGPTHVNNWLSSINVPGISTSTLKRREREIGPIVEHVAKKSCKDALTQETLLSKISDSEPVNLVGCYDMGWQRRCSGRTYNSKSGHGSLIGHNSGLVIGYGSRSSTCRTCEIAHSNNRTPHPHDCRYNWSGSSKSMEASVGVELIKDSHSPTQRVNCIVMDDDSTTLAHIRQEYDPNITKWSDVNHAKKSLTNGLYNIAKTHKKLTTKLISYFKKCYSYVIAQNHNNVAAVKDGLRNIVPHAFGVHLNCGDWCGFIKNGDSYKHKSFPRGQPLNGAEFKEDLTKLFEIHACNAARLAPNGSTKANESFNNIVASKAPKSRHYSSSESLDFRIGAAVCQKNIGHDYLSKVFHAKKLSPGKALVVHANRLKKQSKLRLAKSSTKAFKSRRVLLKENRNKFTSECEIREGPSYQTNIDTDQNVIDITSIPAPSVLPPVQCIQNLGYSLVYFDLETTSTEHDTGICQISAVSSNESFNQYILPDKEISPFASNVTHLTRQDNVLLYKGVPVPTVDKKTGVAKFISWLEPLGEIVLVAHNAKVFDSIHIQRVAQESGLLTNLQSNVVGFIDTLPFFRKLYPHLKCHKEVFLAKELLGKTFDAHNALEDCQILADLVNLNSSQLYDFSFSFQWSLDHFEYLKHKRSNLSSYNAVISRKIISKNMAEKCAASGLKFDHICLAYTRNGELGLSTLLGEKVNGKVRVTNRKPVIEKLCDYIMNKK